MPYLLLKKWVSNRFYASDATSKVRLNVVIEKAYLTKTDDKIPQWYIFDNEKQVEKDCLNKYIKKGEITTLTNVITTHYICKCLPHELRIMVNNKDIKKSFENMKASNNKEIREITKDFLMDTASIICKTEIEQLGMIEIQKKYGKLDIH